MTLESLLTSQAPNPKTLNPLKNLYSTLFNSSLITAFKDSSLSLPRAGAGESAQQGTYLVKGTHKAQVVGLGV